MLKLNNKMDSISSSSNSEKNLNHHNMKFKTYKDLKCSTMNFNIKDALPENRHLDMSNI